MNTPSFPTASLIRRLAALVYDTLILSGLCFVATLVLVWLNGGQAFAAHDARLSVWLMMVCFVFVGWCWTHGGQTPGMRAWNIQVEGDNGQCLSWTQALVRFLSAGLSLVCLGSGYLWMLIDSEKRTWPDRWSGTRVVYIRGVKVQPPKEGG